MKKHLFLATCFLFLTACDENNSGESNVAETKEVAPLVEAIKNNQHTNPLNIVKAEGLLRYEPTYGEESTLQYNIEGYQTFESFYNKFNELVVPNDGQIFVLVKYGVENIGKEKAIFHEMNDKLVLISESNYQFSSLSHLEFGDFLEANGIGDYYGEFNLQPLQKENAYGLFEVNKSLFENESFSFGIVMAIDSNKDEIIKAKLK